MTVKIPEGYHSVNNRSNGQKVFTNGKDYITPDADGHKGGIWKRASSIKNLLNKGTRMGTYDENLKRIGD